MRAGRSSRGRFSTMPDTSAPDDVPNGTLLTAPRIQHPRAPLRLGAEAPSGGFGTSSIWTTPRLSRFGDVLLTYAPKNSRGA